MCAPQREKVDQSLLSPAISKIMQPKKASSYSTELSSSKKKNNNENEPPHSPSPSPTNELESSPNKPILPQEPITSSSIILENSDKLKFRKSCDSDIQQNLPGEKMWLIFKRICSQEMLHIKIRAVFIDS